MLHFQYRQRYVLLLLSVLFMFISWLTLIHGQSVSMIDDDASENPALRKKWEEQMLADPATGIIPPGMRLRELQTYRSELSINAAYRGSRGANWQSRGPWNVGGRTRSMAVDIKNEQHLIAGGVSGGIWSSEDGGNLWTRRTTPMDHPGVVSIAQDTRLGHEHIWYALSGELYGTSASGGGHDAFYLGDGAFVSVDNGNTWKPLAATAVGNPGSFSTSYQGGWKIDCSNVDSVNTCVYMAVYGGIYRSTDTGKSWKVVLGAGNDSYFTEFAIAPSGIIYSSLSWDGNAKGFFRSADGVNFTNITPSFIKSANRTVIEIDVNNENVVYFLSELPSDSSGGVETKDYEGNPEWVSLCKYQYLSGDGSGNGGLWSNLSTNLPVNTPNQFDRFNCQGGYDLMIETQAGSEQIFIGGTNLYRSRDGFKTGSQIQQIGGYALATTLPNFGVYPNHHPDQHNLYFLKDASQAYSVSDGGVKFTQDINANEVTWQEKSLGYLTSQFYTVAIDESKPFDQWLLGGLQDNGNYISYSNNPKDLWNMTINGDGSYNFIAPDRSYYIISTQLGNVRKVVLDLKGNVMLRRRIDPDGIDKSQYNFINPLVVDPSENHTLYMPVAKRIARLNNVKNIEVYNDNTKFKSGWTFSADTITTRNFNTGNRIILPEVSTLAYAPSDPNILYVGTNLRDIFMVNNARSSAMNFTRLDTFRLPSGGYVSGIAVDPDSAKNVLICYSNWNINSLFYSNDSGKKWYLVGGNLETSNSNNTGAQPSVRCVKILRLPNGKRRYFTGTSVGLYSTDSLVLGTSSGTNKTVWEQESPEKIGANIVTDIRVRQSDGYVVIGTHGGGVFETYYTGFSSPLATPVHSVTHIYPNPAGSSCYFTFTASENYPASAGIYDLSGRRVKKLFDQTFRSGTFTIQADVSELPTGLYFLVYDNGQQKKPEVQKLSIRR